MPLYPLAPAFGTLALCYVIYANWIDPEVGRPSLIVSLVLIVLATAYFLVKRRGSGVAIAMTGPPAESAADGGGG
jgi:hypothetical protein